MKKLLLASTAILALSAAPVLAQSDAGAAVGGTAGGVSGAVAGGLIFGPIGAVIGGFGLGLVNKAIEPFWGAVLAKIAVLVLIVLFIQKRPQGMFALKGRSAEA